MAGNKNSGRTKKSIAEKKLKGTYRKDRDLEQETVELTVQSAGVILTPDTVIEPPAEITDSFVKDYYRFHTNQLIQLNILSAADIPELNQLYFTLQQLRIVNKQIQETDLYTDLETYEKLTKLSVKLGTRFSQLASKYYISPTARTKLTIEQLTVEKMSEDKSVIGKLLAGKKS